MKKILVTGGSGYIGSVLVSYMLKRDLFVRAIDITQYNFPLLKKYKKNFEFIKLDIRKINDSVFKDIFAVIHLAAFSDEASSDKNPKETYMVNTKATIKLAKKAKQLGVKRFIFASSSSIYDKGIDKDGGPKDENDTTAPSGHYSISKRMAERKLQKLADNDFCVLILRKGTVFGYSPTMRFDLVLNAMVKKALEQNVINVFCKGLQYRPLLAIEDAAAAYYTALKAPHKRVSGEIFNIACDNFLVKDIALLVQKTLKRHFFINPQIIFEQDDRKDRSYRIKTKKAKDLLGFTPKLTIEQTIIALVKKLRQEGFHS